MNFGFLGSSFGGMGRGGAGVGYDYYVDSVSGNDANDGRSEATAFQTIAGLPALSAGVRIKLVGNSSWREQLDLPANGYVEGDGNALLNAADLLSAGDVSKTAGRTNVYQFTKTLPSYGAGNAYLAMWENDTRYARVADEATCDSTAGSLYIASDNGGSTTFKFHAFSSTDPTSDGKTREYTVREYGLNARNSDGVTVKNLKTCRQANIGGSLWVGRSSIITDVEAYDGNNHCVQHKDGCTLTRVTARNCYYLPDTPTHFVTYEDTPPGTGCSYNSCVAEQEGAAITAYAYFAHRGASGTFGTITYTNCEVNNILRGWGMNYSQAQFVIANPTYSIASNGTPYFCNAACLMQVSGGTYSGVVNLVRFTSTGDNSVISLSGITAACSADVISGASGGNGVTLTMTNCIVSEGGSGTGGITILGTTPTLTMNGSKITTQATHRYIYLDGNATLTLDNNQYTGNKGFRNNSTNYADLAAWKAATGQDTNSVNV